jgi:hypothetical protein
MMNNECAGALRIDACAMANRRAQSRHAHEFRFGTVRSESAFSYCRYRVCFCGSCIARGGEAPMNRRRKAAAGD